MRTKLLLGGVLAMLLSACQSGGAAGQDAGSSLPKTGTQWRLSSGLDVKLPPAAEVTLEFGADGAISGNSGCNRYNGRMTVEGDSVSLSPLAATKRGCVGLRGQIESSFFAAMAKVDAMSVDDGKLHVKLSDGSELLFDATADTGNAK